MIVVKSPDGSHDIHLTSEEAGHLLSALGLARPRGTAVARPSSGDIRVHVHGEATEAPPARKPIEVR